MNYFWNFKCFQHFKRFRYKYSILFNFQGPVCRGLSTGDLFILSRPVRFVKHFFHLFSSDFEVLSWFRAFAEVRSAGRLSIILQSRTSVNPLFQLFCGFQRSYDSSPKTCGIFGQCSENTKCCVKVLDLPLNNDIIVLQLHGRPRSCIIHEASFFIYIVDSPGLRPGKTASLIYIILRAAAGVRRSPAAKQKRRRIP